MRTFRWAAALWAAVVFVAHSIPRRQLEKIPGEPWFARTSGADKLIHVVLFGVLGGLAGRAFPGRPAVVSAAGLAYGVALEVYQHLAVAGRTGAVEDLAADALGLALGVAAARWASRRAPGGPAPQ